MDEDGKPQWNPTTESPAKTPAKSSSSTSGKTPAKAAAKTPARSSSTVPAKVPEKVLGEKVKDFNPPMATRGRSGQAVEVVDLDDEDSEEEVNEEVRRTSSGKFGWIFLLFKFYYCNLKGGILLSWLCNI